MSTRNVLAGLARTLFPACLLIATAAPAAVAPLDVVTVNTVAAPAGSVVDVPVSIRDASGTPLGTDQPAGSHIQAYSLKVNYSPAAAVQSVTFTRAGVTASLTPSFESSPSAAGSTSLLDTFSEMTNPIPLTLNSASPAGDPVAHLLVTLSPSATPGTVITLTLDPVLTQLSNQAGTTSETTGNVSLALVNGSITVGPPTILPTLSQWALIGLALLLAAIAIRRV
jgi:hypothetical protein